MKKSFYRITTDQAPETFPVNIRRDRGAVGPDTEGSIRYIPDQGFEVTMRCYEENPQAVYLNPNDPVCRDSCMEAFLNFYPELPEYGYINMEVNSKGVVLCGFGPVRTDRARVLDLGCKHPAIDVTKGEENGRPYWQIRYVIDHVFLETLYKRPCEFAPGHRITGNFYKCGDRTPSPHWYSWSPIADEDFNTIGFHCPNSFGELQIG